MILRKKFNENFSSLESSNVNLEDSSLCSGIQDMGEGLHLIWVREMISFDLGEIRIKFTKRVAMTKILSVD